MPYDPYEDELEDEYLEEEPMRGRFGALAAPEEEYTPGPMTMEDMDMRFDAEIPENPVEPAADSGNFMMPPPQQPFGAGGFYPGAAPGQPQVNGMSPEGGGMTAEDAAATNNAVKEALAETLQEKARLRKEAAFKFQSSAAKLTGG